MLEELWLCNGAVFREYLEYRIPPSNGLYSTSRSKQESENRKVLSDSGIQWEKDNITFTYKHLVQRFMCAVCCMVTLNIQW